MKSRILIYWKKQLWTFTNVMLFVGASIVTIGSKRKTRIRPEFPVFCYKTLPSKS